MGIIPDEHRCEATRYLVDAAITGHFQIAKAALAEHADPNARDDLGMPVLHLAAKHGHAEIVELLLDRGIDPNERDPDARTALHLAEDHRRPDVAKILIARGADPNAKRGVTRAEKIVDQLVQDSRQGHVVQQAERRVARSDDRDL
jgi:ankyrin repeat protein